MTLPIQDLAHGVNPPWAPDGPTLVTRSTGSVGDGPATGLIPIHAHHLLSLPRWEAYIRPIGVLPHGDLIELALLRFTHPEGLATRERWRGWFTFGNAHAWPTLGKS